MLNHSFEYSHLNSLLSSCNRENWMIYTDTVQFSSEEAHQTGKKSSAYHNKIATSRKVKELLSNFIILY
jgi:hypothetical protein